MFIKSPVTLDVHNVFNMVNLECTSYNKLIQYDNSHNLYISSDLRMSLPNVSGTNTFVYLRNIFPSSKTAAIQWFDYKIYKGYTEEKLNSIVMSNNIGMRSFIGQYLHKTNDMEILYYNQTNNTITTKNGVDIYTNVKPNSLNPLMYYSKGYNVNWFYFVTNCIGQFTLVPAFESILYPMEGTKNYKGLYSHFEIFKNTSLTITDYRFNRCSPLESAVIHNPRYLFSYDGGITYYKFNVSTHTWDIQTPINSAYFTYSEFLNKGNSYDEYRQITQDDWNLLHAYDHRYTILLNNYISPIFIREEFWSSRLDISDWLIYSNSTTSHSSFMSGAM